MKTQNYRIIELKQHELKEINGGSDFSQKVFRAVGRIWKRITDMVEAEAEHGATGVM